MEREREKEEREKRPKKEKKKKKKKNLIFFLDSLDVPKNKSEDCLYLEVFAPPVGAFQDPAAVILWYHGGDWHEGGESFDIYSGAHHAAHLNTMVVVTNYRLVALGFLLPHPKCGDANVGIEVLRPKAESFVNLTLLRRLFLFSGSKDGN